jgi:hypothetical protein
VVGTGDGAGDRLTRRGREEFDLRAAAPQVARDLRRRLDARRREYADGMPETRQVLSEADRARLRALGYAGDS